MAEFIPPGAVEPLLHTPPELSYPGLSPQLLARTKQLWSARGLDFDQHWRAGIRALPGFRAVPSLAGTANSAGVDLIFLFDHCLLWSRAMRRAAAAGSAAGTGQLSAPQWFGLAAVFARIEEQMIALRLLALTELPLPAMQIARSISEDADMVLVLLIRPRLAERFAGCRSVEEANEFWRRHISGGRAFRTISEKLYAVGVDHSTDTEYAKWRRTVLSTLGAAVHSNALSAGGPARRPGQALLTDDSLHFAAFRIHELCAYAQLLAPALSDELRGAGEAAADPLATLAAPLTGILVCQIQSLTAPVPSADGNVRRH